MNSNDYIVFKLFSEGLLPPAVSTLHESAYQSGFKFHNHTYSNEVEIVYVLHGASYVGIDNKQFIRVKKNDCLLIFPKVTHNFFLKENENCKIIDLVFNPGDLSFFTPTDLQFQMRFLYELITPQISYLRFLDNGEIRAVLEHILNLEKSPTFFSSQLQKLYYCELYILLSKILVETRDETGKPKNAYITTGLDYLTNFFTNQVSIDDVSTHAGISSRHFTRLFFQEMGMTVQDYLSILRIKKAKDLLQNSDMGITQIAYSLGFNSSQYFTTCFKRIEHVTPTNYRRMVQSA
jgi:AraC family transcriptional regulator, melibiose operon regulatory protein